MWFVQNHCRDPRPSYDHLLRYLGAAQAIIASRPASFRRYYGSEYVSGDLATWLEDKGMDHVRGAPSHPQTQGKIGRWHQTMKNWVLLEHYYLPVDLERQIEAFVDYYNTQRYHESLNNVTPADVYVGRAETILRERNKIKNLIILKRRLKHQNAAA